jgi:diguanylate cyclase (GGDEF)-like protein/PAS domain S-box-containing protein
MTTGADSTTGTRVDTPGGKRRSRLGVLASRVAAAYTRAATGARPREQDVLPFAVLLLGAVGVVGVVMAASPQRLSPQVGLALAVLGIAVVAIWVAARGRRRTWVDPLGPWLVLVSLGLLRDALGGAASGVGTLVGVPIVWLALFGTFGDLAVAALLAALAFLAPALLTGDARDLAVEWRPALVWAGVALLAAPVVQSVVRRFARESRSEREAAAQLRGIMGGATLTSIIATDPQGLITDFNLGAEQMLRWSAADAIGRPAHELVHDADELAAAAAQLGVEPGIEVFATLAEHQMPSREWTYIRQDGRRISVRLAVTEIRGDAGDLVGYLGVAVDTTAAVELRRELKEAQALWRLSMDHLPDTAVLVLDRTLEVSLSTGGGARRQGLATAAGRQVDEVFSPENAALLQPLIAAAIEGEEGVVELTAVETGDEHEVWVSPLPGTTTTSGAALIMARDVSRDRARERELRASHDRVQRLFVDAPHGIAVLGRDGVVRQVNPSLCVLLGRGEGELVGRPLADLGSAEDETIATLLADAADGDAAAGHADWTVVTPAGDEVHLSLSSTVLTSASGAATAGPQDEVLVNFADVSERFVYEQQLAHLADHDVLTGLANRRKFSAELDRHLAYCRRYGARGALLLIDLDHFKEVNDTLGHSAGDELLVGLADVLRRSVRASDVVARLGGDEFAVLLLESDLTGTELVAKNLVAAVRGHRTSLGAAADAVTASVGAVVIEAPTTSAEELLSDADALMYQAKNGGRDGWAVLRSEDAQATAAPTLTERLEEALAGEGFRLQLQPIWDVRAGRVTGAEALLRLGEGDTALSPGQFLPHAERSDLILAVDRWVVEHAVPLLARCQAVRPDFELAVNLSGRSVGDAVLERVILEALDRHGVDPHGLVLEVTETAAVSDLEAARGFAERVTATGCRFALDDFGAGFGSFHYLKNLPFDYVKIDGEFVTACDVNPADRAIVSSVVGIAHRLGKQAVAEFVTSPSILQVLEEEGVDFAQGHHIGRPLDPDAFLDSLAQPARA